MICTRFVNGEESKVDLSGIFEGRTAFLVGGSPTLLLQDYKRLASREVLSFGLNNAGKVVKCFGYFMGDNPRCFFNSVVHDRQAMRFLQTGYQRFFPKDDTNVYFFTRKDGQPDINNIRGEDVVSGNNTLAMAIFMLLSFKVSRIVLCGSTFNAGSYGHGQVLGPKETNWNSRLYTQQATWLKGLSGLFSRLGVEFIDTSVLSKLSDTYRTMDLSTAIDLYSEKPKNDQKSVMHCRELKVSGGGEVDESLSSTYFEFERNNVPVVTAVKFPEDPEDKLAMALTLLLLSRSLAESNRGREFIVYADSKTAEDKLFASVMGYAMYWHPGDTASVYGVPAEARKKMEGDRGSYIDNLRLYIPALKEELGECIWLDADTIVRQDLTFLVDEARSKMSRSQYIAGCPVSDSVSAIDPGVMYMDLDGMKRSGADGRCYSVLTSAFEAGERAVKAAVNSIRPASVNGRWNVRPFSRDSGLLDRLDGYAMEQIRSSYVLHLSGDKRLLPDRHGPAADMVFRYLAGIRTEMAGGAFNDIMALDVNGKWRRRIDAAAEYKEISNG